MLSIEGVHTYYGHIHALRDVSLRVEEGEIVTLIGANGAGKSTLLMTICGDPQAKAGRIVFNGADITGWPGLASRIRRKGGGSFRA
jgi:branched-chain amino acid transport system ATP-binding protein